jgi:hypothetical protein
VEGTESIDSEVHHLAGGGNASHLGHFTYSADITIDPGTGDGSGTVIYTAADGDQIQASTRGAVIGFDFPSLALRETQTITGGTGRFTDSSGTIIMERTLNLETGVTTGSFTGTLSRGH